MEPRRARNAINYTDCPRPLLGSGRNRYVPVASACRGSMINRYARVPAGAAERDKLTWHSYYPAAPFFGLFSQFHYYNRKVISLHRHSANGKVRLLRSCELIRPKLLCPFVEFHKAIFGVGGWDPYSLPRFSNLLRSSYKQPRHAGKETGADASAVSLYAAVRSFVPMLVRFLHGTGRRVLPCKITNPAFRSQLINPACKVGPLKSGLAVLLRMETGSLFARHLRVGGFPDLLRGRFLHWILH